MKVGILAGGLGTRLSEETAAKPKPMVEIGDWPILWHIMKLYSAHGFDEFAIALGYKGEIIKDYFINYAHRANNLTINISTGEVQTQSTTHERWLVHLRDTGADALTGDRIKQLAAFVGPETFMLTYGDGVSDVDIGKLLAFHRQHGKLATMTVVRPPARFGSLSMDGPQVLEFLEKPVSGEGWINGGFFVLEPGVVDYIQGEGVSWERRPMEQLAAEGQLMAYRHDGFWQCMDTLRDVRLLQELWESGQAPWKTW